MSNIALDTWIEQRLFNEELPKATRLLAALFCAKLDNQADSNSLNASHTLIKANSNMVAEIEGAVYIAVQQAMEASKQAYAPYSTFHVGATIVTEQLRLFSGCNVENASYGLTMCAERNAVGAAVLGATPNILATVVFTNTPSHTWPCGACRQVLMEFGPNSICISVDAAGNQQWMPLDVLLPHSFNAASLTV